jgi:hypothetical protein
MFASNKAKKGGEILNSVLFALSLYNLRFSFLVGGGTIKTHVYTVACKERKAIKTLSFVKLSIS